MAATQTTQNTPDAFRSLMRDDRVYSSSPLWRVSVSPRGAFIGIRSLWKLGITSFVLFTCLALGLHFTSRWFSLSDDVGRFCTIAAWFSWAMAAAFLGGTLVFEKYRSRKAWFICCPLERTVSCPRLDKVFRIDNIEAMQLITGWFKSLDVDGPVRTKVAQLNLIVKEGGQLQRYPLIGDYGPARLSKHAEFLSEHCGIRFLKDKALTVADWA